MAKLKLSVSSESWDEAGSGSVESPKPGLYDCEVDTINTGYAVDEATKKPDKDRPRLEVIIRVTDPKAKDHGYDGGSALNARLWSYITFGTNVQWKLAGFLKAVGVPYKKVGGKIECDLDTSLIAKTISDADTRTLKAKPAKETGHAGKKVLVKVKSGSNRDGEYRAEIAAILPPRDDSNSEDDFPEADDGTEELAEDEFVDEAAEDEVTEDGDEEFEEEGGDEEMADDDEEEYTEDSLKTMEPANLKEVAKAFDIKFGGKKKSQVISLILEAQSADDDGDEPF